MSWRIEAFAGGCAGVIEDYRVLSLYSDARRIKPRKLMQADKGHAQGLKAFLDSVRQGQASPIGVESLVDTTLVSFAALESVQRGEPIALDDMRKALSAEDSGDSPQDGG